MSRKKLSEYRTKSILGEALGQAYEGLEVDVHSDDWRAAVKRLDKSRHYVVKVDQAVKGRFKKGLVKLDRAATALEADIVSLSKKGYQYFLVEVYEPHEQADEKYLSLQREREGVRLTFADIGGIDIEAHGDALQSVLATPDKPAPNTIVPARILNKILTIFNEQHMSFLEINPLLIKGDQCRFLDAAAEVDEEAEFFVDGWTGSDIRSATSRSGEELAVQELNKKSQASFSLEVLNRDGSIFLLLSGGGASVVVADEIFSAGKGKELANYGEYSGAPNREETHLYTQQLLKLLLGSKSAGKTLLIGGGVANFTDVRITFEGIIDALREVETQLKKQHVKVYVRRGGPFEEQGLNMMKSYLEASGLLGEVSGPELPLSEIVVHALEATHA